MLKINISLKAGVIELFLPEIEKLTLNLLQMFRMK